jgi:hypothetical protein
VADEFFFFRANQRASSIRLNITILVSDLHQPVREITNPGHHR